MSLEGSRNIIKLGIAKNLQGRLKSIDSKLKWKIIHAWSGDESSIRVVENLLKNYHRDRLVMSKSTETFQLSKNNLTHIIQTCAISNFKKVI